MQRLSSITVFYILQVPAAVVVGETFEDRVEQTTQRFPKPDLTYKKIPLQFGNRMPPPIYKLSRASGDQENYESLSEDSSDDDLKDKTKQDSISIVKSILGPSLEDAVLRTLEFGRSLIQKSDENSELNRGNSKKSSKNLSYQSKELTEEFFDEEISPRKQNIFSKYEEDQEIRRGREARCSKKRIVFTANIDKDIPFFAKEQINKKVSKVSKIRSLDSDLKQITPSPEKIKRQLEALIQINKDEPPECARPWALQGAPVNFTVMPSLCIYGNDGEINGSCSNKVQERIRIEESSPFRGPATYDRQSYSTAQPLDRPPYDKPPYDRPPYDRPSYDRPPNERPPNERPPNERPPNERPPNDKPPNDKPPNERQPYDRPPYDRPPYDRPPYDRSQYNRPQYDRPQYDRPSEKPPKSKFVRQTAPGFLSNALGPTIDVSIIDNIKIVRDLLKCEKIGDDNTEQSQQQQQQPQPQPQPQQQQQTPTPQPKQPQQDQQPQPQQPLPPPPPLQQQQQSDIPFDPTFCGVTLQPDPCGIEPQNQFTDSRYSSGRYEELQKRIYDLEIREKCLQKQIELEEIERANKRKAFEEEEKRRSTSGGRPDLDKIKNKVSAEEERLSKLKNQCEVYQKDIVEAKQRREFLRRNKSLLDAWDVIASRVCHTKLPPFTRLYTLERKCSKQDRPGDIHCCLMNPESKNFSLVQCQSNSQGPQFCNPNRDLDCTDSLLKSRCQKLPDVPYPLQRDVTCGLHQTLKLCVCGGNVPRRPDNAVCSTDDEQYKRTTFKKDDKMNTDTCFVRQESIVQKSIDKCIEKTSEKCLEKPIERCLEKPMDSCVSSKHLNRSRSDTVMRKDKNSKILKVMWAVTRINIFQDNIRTYEVMDATTIPPPRTPAKTEGIFVVKNARKKLPSSPKRT